jgi:hypothetical protein
MESLNYLRADLLQSGMVDNRWSSLCWVDNLWSLITQGVNSSTCVKLMLLLLLQDAEGFKETDFRRIEGSFSCTILNIVKCVRYIILFHVLGCELARPVVLMIHGFEISRCRGNARLCRHVTMDDFLGEARNAFAFSQVNKGFCLCKVSYPFGHNMLKSGIFGNYPPRASVETLMTNSCVYLYNQWHNRHLKSKWLPL